ncbi:hypothetical protein [Moraxella lacunata]
MAYIKLRMVCFAIITQNIDKKNTQTKRAELSTLFILTKLS